MPMIVTQVYQWLQFIHLVSNLKHAQKQTDNCHNEDTKNINIDLVWDSTNKKLMKTIYLFPFYLIDVGLASTGILDLNFSC